MWLLSYTPESWQKATTILLPKKGSKLNIKNYRPITLLNSFFKIWEKVQEERLKKFYEQHNLLSDLQFGNRSNMGGDMALFTTKALMAQARKTGRTMHMLHVDLSKAYNRVSRDRLWTILFKNGVKGKLWLALMSTYSKSSEYIKLGSKPWTELDLLNGLRQGSVLSPLLFIISMDALLDALQKTGTGFPVGSVTIHTTAYTTQF
jgi:hypothetical protein